MASTGADRTHARWALLMSESEALLARAAHGATTESGKAAAQVLGDCDAWQAWEKEFGAAMRKVVVPRRRDEQARILRHACFLWIHRAAPFRLIRDGRLRGERRRRIVCGLHNEHSYSRAMVEEHRNYNRSICSYYCSTQIGQAVMGDAVFANAMGRYEVLYAEYFQAYCAVAFVQADADVNTLRPLLPMLKHQACELRSAILNYPLHSSDWLVSEHRLRQPLGDTQRLRRPLDLQL